MNNKDEQILALQAENARLRGALENIEAIHDDVYENSEGIYTSDWSEIKHICEALTTDPPPPSDLMRVVAVAFDLYDACKNYDEKVADRSINEEVFDMAPVIHYKVSREQYKKIVEAIPQGDREAIVKTYGGEG